MGFTPSTKKLRVQVPEFPSLTNFDATPLTAKSPLNSTPHMASGFDPLTSQITDVDIAVTKKPLK